MRFEVVTTIGSASEALQSRTIWSVANFTLLDDAWKSEATDERSAVSTPPLLVFFLLRDENADLLKRTYVRIITGVTFMCSSRCKIEYSNVVFTSGSKHTYWTSSLNLVFK